MAGRIPSGVRKTPAGFYEARWYDTSGERHSATFDTAAEADAYRQEHLRRRRRGGTGDPTAGNTTFAEWWERWMPGRQIRSSTRATDLCYAKNHLLPEFGKWRLVDIRPSDIAAWVAKLMAAGLAPATVRTCRGQLSQCLKAAVREGLLYQNPADATQPPAVPHKEARFLTPDELVRLEAAMDLWWRLLVPFLADTGLRIGEAAALRVRDVNVLAGRVTVSATVSNVTKSVSGASSRRQIGEPKTSAGRRVVPTLTRPTGDRVAALIAERRLGLDDWLFSGRRGAPMDSCVWRSRVWRPAVLGAGLAAPLPTPHALRHTAIGLWIAAGVKEPLRLSRWAGHSSIAVTYGTYGHLLTDEDSGVTDTLARIRAEAERKVAEEQPGEIRQLLGAIS